ncbi:MAG TPA: hypothetical protein VFR07_11175 [Mycobacteriales bacterium]|nr:hypothetical protein [Mycobacteriales bacterium]
MAGEAHPDPAVPVLYLGGLGRSGSTLLERMLGELPGVASLGEVVHLWERALRDDERCGCGRAFSACPFWGEVGSRAFGGWDRLDAQEVVALKYRADRTRYLPRLLLPLLRPSVRRDLLAYVELYEKVYAAAREVSGARAVVDSSKHVSLASCLRWSRRLDLHVLHVVRDSPAVAYSWSRQVVRPEAGPDELMPQYSLLRVAVRWSVDNVVYDLLRMLGTAVRVVRYEDLVADPRSTLVRISRQADLPVQEADLAFLSAGGGVQLQTTHTVAGNPMRFRSGTLVVRADDAWRTQMATRDRRFVAALTAPVRARFGYGRTARAGR